jgi:hypothetical protein
MTAGKPSLLEARLDYLAQHMKQKLVGFLNSRRGIAFDQEIKISDASTRATIAAEERDGS